MKQIYSLIILLIGTVALNAQVIISEFHYDNGGTDENEFVEVEASPSGTSITGYQIVLYNGNNGASYQTHDVSTGTMSTDAGKDYYVILVPGIQNGAPDGIALVDNNGNVLQFISYEGVMVATDGPASGMTSTDVGVSEGNATTTTGSVAWDGTAWQTIDPSTPGSANFGTDPNISISSPTEGQIFPPGTTSIDVEFSVSNFVVGTDGLIGYAVDGANPTIHMAGTSPINITGLTAGNHNVAVALLDMTGTPLNPPIGDLKNFSIASITQVADLAALRADVVANGDGYYEISGDVVVSYVVEDAQSGDGGRNQFFVQDANGGLLIDDPNNTISSILAEGDAISGLKVLTSEFNGVLQGVPQENVTAASSGNTLTPITVTPADFTSDTSDTYESRLILFEDVTFADAGGTFAANDNYDISDGTNTATCRTNFDMADYIGGTIPSGNADVTAIGGEFNGNQQFYIRNNMDVLSNKEVTIQANEVQIVTKGNQILVKGMEISSLEIYNTQGQLVKNQNNLNGLTAGVYLVKLEDNDGNVIVKKFIKR